MTFLCPNTTLLHSAVKHKSEVG